jgi:hypothetical protein
MSTPLLLEYKSLPTHAWKFADSSPPFLGSLAAPQLHPIASKEMVWLAEGHQRVIFLEVNLVVVFYLFSFSIVRCLVHCCYQHLYFVLFLLLNSGYNCALSFDV